MTTPERRGELLDAADKVVQRDGPQASMTAIAAEAGITKPILYRWFGDKGGLYQALAERHVGELLADLRQALHGSRTRRDRTYAVVDAYLAHVEAQPRVYRFLIDRAAAEDSGVRSQVAGFVTTLGEELAVGIAAELGAAPAMSLAWGTAMVGAVQAAGDRWLAGDIGVTRHELATYLTDLLCGGYADPSPSGPHPRGDQ